MLKKDMNLLNCIFLLFVFVMSFSFFYPNYKFETRLIDDNLDILKKNKVIIIGDSRFKHILNNKNEYFIPLNFDIIADSGKEVKWFQNDALKTLSNKIDNSPLYHVIINMGVNDIQFYRPFDDDILLYQKIIKNLKKEYPKVNFYFLSINPVDEDVIKAYYPGNHRTNSEIKYFNNLMFEFSKKNNLIFCSSYDNVVFNIPDGLHYDTTTNQRIIDYINNKCVKYVFFSRR